jgi:hypothetical protein
MMRSDYAGSQMLHFRIRSSTGLDAAAIHLQTADAVDDHPAKFPEPAIFGKSSTPKLPRLADISRACFHRERRGDAQIRKILPSVVAGHFYGYMFRVT